MATLQSARRHYRLSALLARRARTEARRARPRGTAAVLGVIATHQIASAQLAESSVAEMLLEQEIDSAADAILDLLAFTTAPDALVGMLDAAGDSGFDRLVETIVQDAARAAESVATAVRPNIYHVRFVSPPCCSRCAILAGRVYRYSEGFLRHPNCDCSMIPTTVASPLAQDPDELVRQGLVTGLSKADRQALNEGGDLGRIVNVRSQAAGLSEAGRVLARRGRPTPEGIYRLASDRTEAVALLRRYGYVR